KYKTILKMDEILGLDLNKEPQQVTLEITAEMKDLLDKRAKARVEKNWKLSDELRNQLNKLGVEVKDTENGQELAVISD
ncbi:MAG: CysS/YqeB C-terminal domain-containing protein, partial [Candidatus Nanopelagicales bacterium]